MRRLPSAAGDNDGDDHRDQGNHLPPALARACGAAPACAGAAREGIRHLADAQLERAGCAGARAGPRPGRGGPAARPAPAGDRREPAAPVCRDAGGAVAGRDPGAAVPGRRGGRVRLPGQQRGDRLCRGRGPGAGRQAAGDPPAVPATGADLVRRPARPAQVRGAGPGLAGSTARGGPPACRRASGPRGRADRRRAGRRRGGAVLHLGHDGAAEGRDAHPPLADRPRPRRHALRQAEPR